MERVFAEKEKCSGCGVCVERCPKNAITIKADALGFLFPEIDQHLCIDCGVCRKACHMLDKENANRIPRKVLALQSKDPEVLKKSQSGGAFAEIAKCILQEGGTVYGAAMQEDFSTCHIRIDNEIELCKLQGSKYVQSKTVGIFGRVEKDLENQIPVLFSGTPCQVAALNAYLKKGYDQLYTVDVACHGVVAPKLWEDYLAYIRERFGEFTEANFRDKQVGWRQHWESFRIKGKTKYLNIYRRLFHKSYFLRQCCYTPAKNSVICKYGGMTRVSDLTVGDFWGIENTKSNIVDNNTGISLCLINSEKGERLFRKIAQRVIWEEHNSQDILERNPHFANGDPYQPQTVDRIQGEYLQKSFRYIANRYGEAGIRGKILKLSRFLKFRIKRLVKRLER